MCVDCTTNHRLEKCLAVLQRYSTFFGAAVLPKTGTRECRAAEPCIVAEHASFAVQQPDSNSYTATHNVNQPLVLKDFTLLLKQGQGIAIVDRSSAIYDRSLCCRAVLGDLKVVAGTVKVTNACSFVSSTPFIFAGTVKENILFGCSFEESTYQEVIERCKLTGMLAALPEGDETPMERSESNTATSQTQLELQMRVVIARATYSDSRCVILENPFARIRSLPTRDVLVECIADRFTIPSRAAKCQKGFFLVAPNHDDTQCISNVLEVDPEGKVLPCATSLHPATGAFSASISSSEFSFGSGQSK